jgi:hypothetical protein
MALALAGSIGFERAVAWCMEPRSFGGILINNPPELVFYQIAR